jgi:hypothetical protein
MAQGSAITAGQNGSYPPATQRQPLVTVGVHATVKAVKTACLDAALNHARGQADLEKLPARHDSVLPSRQLGCLALQPQPQLTTHTVVK